MLNHRRTITDWLLYPGMQLMRRLRFPAKAALMGLILTLPLAWLTGQALLASHLGLESTRLEVAGAPLVTSLLEAVAQTQKHRGLVNRALAGDASAAEPLSANRVALQAAIDTVEATVAHEPKLNLGDAWQPLRTSLESMASSDGKGLEAGASFQAHSELVEKLRVFLSRVAEASGLLLDSEAAPFHLMHLAVEPLVAWTEALAQLRDRGAVFLSIGAMNVADHANLVAEFQLLEQATANAEMIGGALTRSGEALPAGMNQALQTSNAYAALSAGTFGTLTPSGNAAAFFDTGTKTIDDALEVGRATSHRLEGLLLDRERTLQMQWFEQLGGGVGTMLVVAYLSIAFFRTSFGAIRILQGSVKGLASGDFSARIRLRGTDELSVVANTLDEMTEQLSVMVADIRSNSTLVAQSGLELAEATRSLSARTESQACSLEETGANVQELSSAVRANAHGAEAASDRAAGVRAMAEEGGAAIQSAVASMQDIKASSSRVQEIVGVIEGIAFQTNILALNAAIEAARAGAQGRGFAVVASEVRSLAQRSAASAREIKTLIDASAENVAAGVAQIGGASATFSRIVTGIHEVADSVRVIQTNTSEQSNGLDQIAQAVAQIDEITQRNAQMVEMAFHSSSQLTDRADMLAKAVVSFKLRQGSADEALALVKRATQLYESVGPAALGQMTAPGSGFADRDMYVFAFDREGIYRAFAGKPEKVGTPVRDNPGVDGAKLVLDAFARADRGGGWVDYEITNPQSGKVDAKTSYVEPAGPQLLLGCGVYKQRAAVEAAAPGAAKPAKPGVAIREAHRIQQPGVASAGAGKASKAKAAVGPGFAPIVRA